MAKFGATATATATLLLLTLLLLTSTLTFAARSGPAFPNPTDSAAKIQASHQLGFETEQSEAVEDSCEGVGEEECLMRRTLSAHLDYIYTQKNKP